MTAERNLDDFMGLEYATFLHERENKYFLAVADLNLIAEGSTVEEAHKRLRNMKREFFESHIQFDGGKRIPLPEEMRETSRFRGDLMPFVTKAAIVAVVGGLLVASANISLVYTLESTPKKVAQNAGKYMLRKATKELEKFAEKEITPAKEEKLRVSLRKAVKKLQPLRNELAPLLNCPDSARERP